jgi:hypothetical protein
MGEPDNYGSTISPLLERVARGTFGPSPLPEVRSEVLELIARGRPLDTVLTRLCTHCETLLAGSVVGVCVLDRAAQRFEEAYFPSLASTFAEGIRGARVTDKPGTCAAAIYHGTVVTSEDIGADDRFLEGWRTLNLEHGTKSIQSRPVFSEEGLSLGTFVIGFRECPPAGGVRRSDLHYRRGTCGHRLGKGPY